MFFSYLKKCIFFVGLPRLPTYTFSYFQCEPEFGGEINPGMALLPFSFSFFGQDEIRTHNLIVVLDEDNSNEFFFIGHESVDQSIISFYLIFE